MTDQEVAEAFEVCWNGGELLPPYPRTSSLWEASEVRARRVVRITPAIRVQKRYTFEEKAIACRMFKHGIAIRVIARHLWMPDQTVRGIVGARAAS